MVHVQTQKSSIQSIFELAVYFLPVEECNKNRYDSAQARSQYLKHGQIIADVHNVDGIKYVPYNSATEYGKGWPTQSGEKNALKASA